MTFFLNQNKEYHLCAVIRSNIILLIRVFIFLSKYLNDQLYNFQHYPQ